MNTTLASYEANTNNLSVKPPWVESPFTLISWLDMLEFSAHKFYNIGASLGWARYEVAEKIEDGYAEDRTIDSIVQMVDRLRDQLGELGCRASRSLAVDLSFSIEGREPKEVIQSKIDSLNTAMTAELESHVFLWIEGNKVEFYNKTPSELVSLDFARRFPVAAVEFEEGCKCYACDRPTAAVFHFMRVTDSAVRAFGASFGYKNHTNNNWGKIFEEASRQIKLPLNQKSSAWNTHEKFLNESAADFKAIQRAWRDTTMHLDKTYTEAQALDILRAIAAFMRQFSSQVDESGNFV